ncbi:UDP-3-O-(3-hydroxymyristoyl)glucosamine N-acyltransferase [Chitinasiproducens palmae]|uniref:UDP-3-O-acylglucosamine N-acyltransferase n=1 Tax=Chitinasiproducens palmae TaxID=1770053 RepID=A0A1H2PMV3_9BURK|nr:UDP-3-O-(3-hydroxymyristoyl)glucosamine N-acyltransferase [Chitinasiproducens palmae]SDV47466.1 UDP-3-O-[3-hydroxymyristoyl] glucosamine N-acyltransferase [Chitinasiproducens palmae]
MGVKLALIAELVGGRVVGDAEREVASLAPLDRAGPDHIAFLANPKYLHQLADSSAGAVLIRQQDLDTLGGASAGRSWIVTDNPYAGFARVAQHFVAAAEPRPRAGVDPRALVEMGATVDETASIGPFAIVEAGASIGARARVGAHAFVGRGAVIGEDVLIHPRATIHHGCRVGARTIIHSGAVIGADGFGFAPDFSSDSDPEATGQWVKIPQVGGVTLGQDVEIGANTTIDRGAMADTVVEDDVKIDNLVQIAHNCRIGAHTVIAACAGIAGSSVIGRHCMIGGAVGIAGHVTLGDRVVVTAKSGVSKSLRGPGVYTSAFPAIANADWNRNAAVMRNLDTMRQRLKQLEATVADLSGK